jgi:hypothetical protein
LENRSGTKVYTGWKESLQWPEYAARFEVKVSASQPQEHDQFVSKDKLTAMSRPLQRDIQKSGSPEEKIRKQPSRTIRRPVPALKA